MELCMREKAVFFLPLNILMVWFPAFLAARHTTVCLDLSALLQFPLTALLGSINLFSLHSLKYPPHYAGIALQHIMLFITLAYLMQAYLAKKELLQA